MGAGGGGAWKVAYADFVTAMMAFFLVMWITAQSKPVKVAIASYFKDPFSLDSEGEGGGLGKEGSPMVGPLKSGHGPGRGATKGYLRTKDRNSKDAATTKPGLRVMHDAGSTRSGTIIQFDEQSAELGDSAKHQLNDLVQVLAGRTNKVEIRGHASRRPLPPDSPFVDPWQLSYARSQATMKYLVTHGIEAQRIRLSQGGAFEPQQQNVGGEWYKLDSRVEVFALNEYVEDFQRVREER